MNFVRKISVTEKVLRKADELEENGRNFWAGAVSGVVDSCFVFGAIFLMRSTCICIGEICKVIAAKKG